MRDRLTAVAIVVALGLGCGLGVMSRSPAVFRPALFRAPDIELPLMFGAYGGDDVPAHIALYDADDQLVLDCRPKRGQLVVEVCPEIVRLWPTWRESGSGRISGLLFVGSSLNVSGWPNDYP